MAGTDAFEQLLDNVRFADGWALYDLDDLPERHSPERVREVLAFASVDSGD